MRPRDLLGRAKQMLGERKAAKALADFTSRDQPSRGEMRALLEELYPGDDLPPANLPLCSWRTEGGGWVTPCGRTLPPDGIPSATYDRDNVFHPDGMPVEPDDAADLEFVKAKMLGQVDSPKAHHQWILRHAIRHRVIAWVAPDGSTTHTETIGEYWSRRDA